MNGGVYSVSVDEMKRLILSVDQDSLKMIVEFAERSNPLLAGVYNQECVCVFGLIPVSVFSDQAYLWLHVTDAIRRHGLKFARHAKRWIRSAPYSVIAGHCVCDNLTAQSWVSWLGAEFGKPEGRLVPFRFVRN